MREDLIERLRVMAQWLDQRAHFESEPETKASHSEDADTCRQSAAALEAAREYVAEADRRVGEQFNNAQRSEAYALEKAVETLTLTKELEAAREDAERYRWLRDCDAEGESLVMTADGRELKTCEDLDAAIDQARGKGIVPEQGKE